MFTIRNKHFNGMEYKLCSMQCVEIVADRHGKIEFYSFIPSLQSNRGYTIKRNGQKWINMPSNEYSSWNFF